MFIFYHNSSQESKGLEVSAVLRLPAVPPHPSGVEGGESHGYVQED